MNIPCLALIGLSLVAGRPAAQETDKAGLVGRVVDGKGKPEEVARIKGELGEDVLQMISEFSSMVSDHARGARIDMGPAREALGIVLSSKLDIPQEAAEEIARRYEDNIRKGLKAGDHSVEGRPVRGYEQDASQLRDRWARFADFATDVFFLGGVARTSLRKQTPAAPAAVQGFVEESIEK
ncbi:MAG: hypothetical protein WC728_14935 [Elusimicrobiota bacterium]